MNNIVHIQHCDKDEQYPVCLEKGRTVDASYMHRVTCDKCLHIYLTELCRYGAKVFKEI